MLNNLFGHMTNSNTGEVMYWVWANNHPYLYAAIEILRTTPLVIALYIALKIAQVIFKRG
jgi:hypothetical protein